MVSDTSVSPSPDQALLAANVVDPMMPLFVGVAFTILVIGLVLRRFGQPQVVAYLIVGVVLGPHVLDLVSNQAAVSRVGDVGVILLLFFLGMEVSLDELIRRWRVAVGGTTLQVTGSLGVAWAIGQWLGWPLPRTILIGFVISLSSTAVVVAVLTARNELHEQVGKDALSILLVQDVAIAPMLIVLGLLAGGPADPQAIALQLVGGVLITGLVVVLVRRKSIPLPFGKLLVADHEFQVFAAGLLCFGLALATGLLGLSSALGAFVAGLVVGSAPGTDWVHHALEPFRILLVALFFVSIGLLVDLQFIGEHIAVVGLLVVGALVVNTILNTLIFRGLRRPWKHALYTAAVLSQIGEFSFVLAEVGRSGQIISEYGHRLTIATIATTLLVSPAWIAIWRAVRGAPPAPESDGAGPATAASPDPVA